MNLHEWHKTTLLGASFNTIRIALAARQHSVMWEKIFFVGSRSVDYTSVVKAWYKEDQDYTYETNKCSKVCRHYSGTLN